MFALPIFWKHLWKGELQFLGNCTFKGFVPLHMIFRALRNKTWIFEWSRLRRMQMCIFHLPTSSVIPLHDHPGMSVYSRVLYGSMHVKAYDWADPHVQKSNGPEYSTGLILNTLYSWHNNSWIFNTASFWRKYLRFRNR